MKLDVDKVLDGILPWDFDVVVNGVSHRTKPPAIGTVAVLQKLTSRREGGAEGGGSADAGELVGPMADLFVTPPDFSTWTLQQLIAALNGVLLYWRENLRKNSRPIAPAVAEAMGATPEKSSTSGSSTPS